MLNFSKIKELQNANANRSQYHNLDFDGYNVISIGETVKAESKKTTCEIYINETLGTSLEGKVSDYFFYIIKGYDVSLNEEDSVYQTVGFFHNQESIDVPESMNSRRKKYSGANISNNGRMVSKRVADIIKQELNIEDDQEVNVLLTEVEGNPGMFSFSVFEESLFDKGQDVEITQE